MGAGCSYFCHGNFPGFQENLKYFGIRLSKLQVDTRAVARSFEIYQTSCDPYLSGLFPGREAEAKAALEMLSSVAFVTISGAYFDTKTLESSALLAVLDAELAAADLSVLLQRVLDVTTRTFQASVGAVLLREPEADFLRVASSFGLGGIGLPEDFRITVGVGFSGKIAATGEPAMVLDTSAETGMLTPLIRDKAKSLWGVPLKVEGETIGVLVIGFSKPYEWLPTERELLRAIGDRTALAIERARMIDALREREQRIAELSGHLLRVQEEERKRISRELHDETGQALVVVEDDGIGIQPRSNSRGHSFGLSGIKERIAMLGGVSRVISAKGKGTRLEITVPVGEAIAEEPAPLRAAVQAGAQLN